MKIKNNVKKRTKQERLNYYIKQQKQDAVKTLGIVEYLKRYEPAKYRKMMDKGV